MDSNPWAIYPRVITSMDYLRQRDILESFRAAASGLRSDPALLPWQMLILDEAHNLSPSVFGDDSDRCRMLRELTKYFEHKLFLTATPHNGYTLSFTGLLELLDPVRFQQKSEMETSDHQQVRLAMVRRLKSELPPVGNTMRFTKREVEGLDIPVEGEEKALYDALRKYRQSGLNLLSGVGKRERRIGEFSFTLLTKRLLSSSYAFACTWWQHVEGLDIGDQEIDEAEHSRDRALAALNDDQEKAQREEDAARQSGAWLARYADKLRPQMEGVSKVLVDLGWSLESVRSGLSEGAVLPPDSKWDELLKWVHEKLGKSGNMRREERLLVFTEYKHTLDYLVFRFARAGYQQPELEELFGGTSSERREQVKEAFNDTDSPVRILAATDTASEGINLQTSCRYVIHFDVPWNPMRLEQRNGRVDRHGQARDVYAFHFSSDDEADLKFLAHVVKKVEQAREDLGSVGQVIDQTLMEHFTHKEVSADELDRRTAVALKVSDEQKDLSDADPGDTQSYTRVYQRLQATQLELGLTSDRIARVLAKAMDLEKGSLEEVEAGVYRIRIVPPSWRQLTKDTLEIKRGKLQGSLPKLVFDPSYFEHSDNGHIYYRTRQDTVLIRLGHPMMKRALGVLRRQQWEPDGLSRWTIQGCDLPGIHELLVLHLSLEANNALRETIHQDVLEWVYQVRGDELSAVDPSYWQQVRSLPRHELSAGALERWQRSVVDQWVSHRGLLEEHIHLNKPKLEAELADRMSDLLKEEQTRQKEAFGQRMRELDALRQPKALERLRKEVVKQRRQMEQLYLLPEIQAEEDQRLHEREWALAQAHHEQMKALLSEERKRVLDKLLPRRYQLENISLQPLAVEYIVRELKGGQD